MALSAHKGYIVPLKIVI